MAKDRKGILIVEDNHADQVLLVRALAANGITGVTTLVNIQEVNDFIAGKGGYSNRENFPLPRIMFVDVALPDGDAREFIPEWKRILGNETLLILMTSSLRPEELQAAYKLGADTFLGKPISVDDLR